MSAAWQYLGSWLPTCRRTQDGLGAGEGERPGHARPANSNVPIMWDIMEVVDEATCGSHYGRTATDGRAGGVETDAEGTGHATVRADAAKGVLREASACGDFKLCAGTDAGAPQREAAPRGAETAHAAPVVRDNSTVAGTEVTPATACLLREGLQPRVDTGSSCDSGAHVPGINGVPTPPARRFRRAGAAGAGNEPRAAKTRALPPPEAIAISHLVEAQAPLLEGAGSDAMDRQGDLGDASSTDEEDEDARAPHDNPPTPITPQEFIAAVPGAPHSRAGDLWIETDLSSMSSSAFHTSCASFSFGSSPSASDDVVIASSGSSVTSGIATVGTASVLANSSNGGTWSSGTGHWLAGPPTPAFGRTPTPTPFSLGPADHPDSFLRAAIRSDVSSLQGWRAWVAERAMPTPARVDGRARPGSSARRVARAMKEEARRALQQLQDNRNDGRRVGML